LAAIELVLALKVRTLMLSLTAPDWRRSVNPARWALRLGTQPPPKVCRA